MFKKITKILKKVDCPFCGGKMSFSHRIEGTFRNCYKCKNCGCYIETK